MRQQIPLSQTDSEIAQNSPVFREEGPEFSSFRPVFQTDTEGKFHLTCRPDQAAMNNSTLEKMPQFFDWGIFLFQLKGRKPHENTV